MTSAINLLETPPPRSVEELEEVLSRPDERLVRAMAELNGDLLVLGAGGKMGPTLCRMARRASDAAGSRRRVIAVSRFTDAAARDRLNQWAVETISADLLDDRALNELPDAANVMAMTGQKFGTSAGGAPRTWAVNCLMAAAICRRFCKSRIVAFSSGNVYGLTTPQSGGSTEGDPPQPIGEYAMTVLGRERIYEHFSRELGIPVALLRLNYAVELRYGVLVDLAQDIAAKRPIDVTMGHFNVIWQAEANSMALQAFAHAASPPLVVNVAGSEILAVRDAAQRLGDLLEVSPEFVGREAPDALLSNGSRGWSLLGKPEVSVDQMSRWIADWVARGGPTLGKPTHFQVRSGAF
jgi:nucleoside-diphosphate-sugar epimerase